MGLKDRYSAMRKIIVLQHISKDGIIQGPGGPTEDPSNGFTQGGWIFPFSDEVLGNEIRKHMHASFDLLLGRITYDIWAPYWSTNNGWPEANQAVKYVASNTITKAFWQPTTILNQDIVEQIKTIKHQEGKDIHVWGSSQLLETLFEHDLIDELYLFVYPVYLDKGKKLFRDGITSEKFRMVVGKTTSKGVLIATYKRV